jgi:hypothetical protein
VIALCLRITSLLGAASFLLLFCPRAKILSKRLIHLILFLLGIQNSPSCMQIKIRDGKDHVGARVKVSAWCHRIRTQGKNLTFLILRDGTGFLQAILTDQRVRIQSRRNKKKNEKRLMWGGFFGFFFVSGGVLRCHHPHDREYRHRVRNPEARSGRPIRVYFIAGRGFRTSFSLSSIFFPRF